MANIFLTKSNTVSDINERSTPIPWGTLNDNNAKKMIDEYRDNQTRKVIVPINGNDERLDALVVRRADIDYLFNRYDELVDELVIILGVRQSDIGLANADQYLTTILVGATDDPNPTPTASKKILVDRVIEFCEPCPERCFTNFDSDTLPDA